jgi:mono/diheme cytochrome c family protein
MTVAGCRATPPGPTETSVATFVKHHVTVRGAGDRAPEPATPEAAGRGRQAFAGYCAACHGLDGHGTGVPFAGALSPPVPDLGSAEVQRYTDGQLHWVVVNGLAPSGMPAARGLLGDEEIWWIVAYLRRLPPAGTLGAPPAYGGGPPPPARP